VKQNKMVLKINHKELKDLTKIYCDKKISFFVRGRFGIGKSRAIREVAMEKAKEKGRIFVEWNSMTENEKLALMDNPEKHYVFIDIRLSEYSPDDIKGLPLFMNNQRAIEFKIPLWALLLEHKDSDGVLFFDEINLATPLVMSSCYKIVYDRVVNQSRINNNWFIMMAGNTEEDRAYTTDVPSPLKDRCGEVELNIPSIEEWSEWAIKNKISSSIIGFLNFKNSNLWKVNYEDNQKYTTPRSWERCSILIDGIKNDDYDKLLLIVSSALGEGVASEYVAFCKLREKVNLKEILKKPEKIKDLDTEKDLGMMYFLISAIADNYRTGEVKFNDVMNITKVLDEIKKVEFVALLWRLCISYNEKFEEEFVKDKGSALEFANKYLKYL